MIRLGVYFGLALLSGLALRVCFRDPKGRWF